MKKNILKRTVSLFLCIIMVALQIFSGFPLQFFSDAVNAQGVDYSPRKPGAFILPWDLRNESSLISSGFNSDSSFTKVGESHVQNASYYLSKDANLWHSSNDDWYAKYKWTFDTGAAVGELFQNREISLRYTGDIRADYHSNAGRHWDKSWDVGKVIISGIYGNNQYDQLISQTCAETSDEVGQSYSLSSYGTEGRDYKGIQFEATHQGCNCGSSGVANSLFYMLDSTGPSITKAYVTTDAAGENQIGEQGGFRAGETGYVVLEFNEYIRFGNNQAESLSLKLNTYWVSNNQKLDADNAIQANLIALKDKKMIFKFSTPSTIVSKDTNVYITGVDRADWLYDSNKPYSYQINNANGEKYATDRIVSTISSKITDLAGNPIDWGNSQKNFEKIAYLDGLAPQIHTITTSMHKGNSIKIGDFYAGPGDSICFAALFTEELINCSVEGISATLNVKDQNGDPVTIAADYLTEMDSCSYTGVDSTSGKLTMVVFKTFEAETGMKVDSEDNRVLITKIAGMNAVTDLRKNPIKTDLSNLGEDRAVEAYMDVDAPSARVVDLTPENGVYDPYVEEDNPYIFTLPIKVDDGSGSGVEGLLGTFGLVDGEGGKPYQWYMSNENNLASRPRWKSGTTIASKDVEDESSLNTLVQMSTNTGYLHIKVDQSMLSGDAIRGAIVINTVDNVGNHGQDEVNFSYHIYKNDKKKPDITLTNSSMETDKDNETITINTSFLVEDEYIKTIKYWWNDGTADITEPIEVPVGTVSREVEATHTIVYSTKQSGKRILKVLAEDQNGNTAEWSKEYTYDETTPISDYSVEQSSVHNPVVTVPKIAIGIPKTLGSPVATILLIPAGTEGTFYVYKGVDEYNYNISEEDILGDTCSGTWYKVTGSIDEETGGKFTSITLASGTRQEICECIKGYYGKLEVTIVTSTDLTKSTSPQSSDSLDFTMEHTVMDRETIYLACNVNYTLEAKTLDEEGKNELPTYTKEEAADIGNANWEELKVFSSLDNLNIELALTNASDEGIAEEADKFGMSALDFGRSSVKLLYQGTNGNNLGKGGSQEEICSWPLNSAADQMVTIPAGKATKTGWYTTVVALYDKSGKGATVFSNYMLLDTFERAFYPDSYQREYKYSGNRYYTYPTRNETDLEDASELNIGLSEPKENSGWTITKNTLTFVLGGNTNDKYGIAAQCKAKIWSKQDPEGEEHAQWIRTDGLTLRYDTLLTCTPVLVTEFKESDYTVTQPENPVDYDTQRYQASCSLPLVEGDNMVCYQVVNTSGKVVTKELLVHVSAKAPQFELAMEGDKHSVTVRAVPNPGQVITKIGRYDSFGKMPDEYDITHSFEEKQMGTVAVYAYDSYGNLGTSSCEVDVDG
ncbi:MAG: hypothetical protein ACI4FX_01655 [Agathobacter sp.]